MITNLNHNRYYKDREDASLKLIKILPIEFFQNNEIVVIGISEAGVFFADKIATKLKAKMDVLLTEPIKAPNNSEIAIAVISETKEVVMHKELIDAFEISEDFIYAEAQRKYNEEVLNYIYKYRKGNDLVDIYGKYVVLVDQCIETGLTMMVALKSVIERGAKNIYIATPVLDNSVYNNLLTVCDEVFCPHKIEDYIGVEYYYDNFEHSSYEDIIKIIEKQEKINKGKIR